MKKLIILAISVALIFGLGNADAQMKPQVPRQVKPYYCPIIKDILIKPYPFTNKDDILVGVRIEFKKTVVLYTPRKFGGKPIRETCECAFTLPDSGKKLMAIYLDIFNVQRKEVNRELIWSGGKTETCPDWELGGRYHYSGYETAICFQVTKEDLERGYIELWGWKPDRPLECADFTIHVVLDVDPKVFDENDQVVKPLNGCPLYFTKSYEIAPHQLPPKGTPGYEVWKDYCPFREKGK